MTKQAWSVSQLTKYIKNVIDNDWQLCDTMISGEISNFTHHSSGHMYFSLKDEKSVIRSIMFAGNNRSLQFIPRNGMKVIANGNVSIYERDGQYQLYIQEMYPAGLGSLHIAYEQLKQLLAKEGLFDTANKQPIPYLPKGIAIITSLTGAAIRDILITLKRRNPYIPTYLVPTTVQGDAAPLSIIDSLTGIEAYCSGFIDVILLARGGGSIEELWAFNNEQVARAIHKCKIPIVVGVGHETDTTIADFVADVRAATPTGAAELVSPKYIDIKKDLETLTHRLNLAIDNKVASKREKLNNLLNAKVFKKPEILTMQHRQLLDLLTKDLQQLFHNRFKQDIATFTMLCQRLEDLSPLKIMDRGYSLTYQEHDIDGNEQRRIIKSISQVEVEDEVNVQLTDGVLACRIRGVSNAKKN
ncbi:exodeoxyribonuclease VII large subunit [Desulfuribacillus alkaliarsenatis]|uniref:Exodeoxyribonuclease 7 large subunit n=1 Tax=Desulfuribacillus alkaliarsenatis TaxID=766136 RepID=A0A1E5G5I0_9FIRM|nr:exodeoxyribonuclease VII large subunit [Desulfuribacillus alkaliarsenatis]OEF98447.1 exodeoxyribonuclease VII large subunit [Desulfuribacillus alkaliarsenatis]